MQITAPSPESPAPPRSAALAEALRRCEAGGCAGVLAGDGLPRLVSALLEEAANAGDGLVWRPRAGEAWLLGTAPGAAARAARHLERMEIPARLLDFPRDLPLLDAALAEDAAAAPARPPSPPALGGLEERARSRPAQELLRLGTMWRMEGGQPRLLAQYWGGIPDALLPDTFRTGAEADWSGHAANLLAQRLLAMAQAGQWPAGRKAGLPLLIDMPWLEEPPPLPAPPPGEGHALVLPLALLPRLLPWAEAARAAGWGLAWRGMAPALLGLAEGDRLPGGFILAEATAKLAAEPGPNPARLALCGAPTPDLLARSARHGFALCHGVGA
ncbi:hypothetical protein EOD42_24900 [Rhodovarius crocodyli]|uniref:Uncharacterized protein n=1 Tax=Rhodovarius crocodyli TaxID=1979269 RepID=A0A437LW94_9PROT|nr:hypothetical protein [Rhodovarius crocodyli]RVT89639.1 hypothetical protein EOD42_24900 [Rhodovarius crocodyli]